MLCFENGTQEIIVIMESFTWVWGGSSTHCTREGTRTIVLSLYDNRITQIIITDIGRRRNVCIRNLCTCTTSSNLVRSSLGTRPSGRWEVLRTYITSTCQLLLETRVGYRIRQGFVSRNVSRNMRGCVQGEVQLLPRISCWNNSSPLHFQKNGVLYSDKGCTSWTWR